eukprot:743398-Rhodomonas_salina.1
MWNDEPGRIIPHVSTRQRVAPYPTPVPDSPYHHTLRQYRAAHSIRNVSTRHSQCLRQKTSKADPLDPGTWTLDPRP